MTITLAEVQLWLYEVERAAAELECPLPCRDELQRIVALRETMRARLAGEVAPPGAREAIQQLAAIKCMDNYCYFERQHIAQAALSRYLAGGRE